MSQASVVLRCVVCLRIGTAFQHSGCYSYAMTHGAHMDPGLQWLWMQHQTCRQKPGRRQDFFCKLMLGSLVFGKTYIWMVHNCHFAKQDVEPSLCVLIGVRQVRLEMCSSIILKGLADDENVFLSTMYAVWRGFKRLLESASACFVLPA